MHRQQHNSCVSLIWSSLRMCMLAGRDLHGACDPGTLQTMRWGGVTQAAQPGVLLKRSTLEVRVQLTSGAILCELDVSIILVHRCFVLQGVLHLS